MVLVKILRGFSQKYTTFVNSWHKADDYTLCFTHTCVQDMRARFSIGKARLKRCFKVYNGWLRRDDAATFFAYFLAFCKAKK